MPTFTEMLSPELFHAPGWLTMPETIAPFAIPPQVGAHMHRGAVDVRLNMDSGELCEQQLKQGSQQRFAPSSHIVNKPKESYIQR
jgi:hypothetical protein